MRREHQHTGRVCAAMVGVALTGGSLASAAVLFDGTLNFGLGGEWANSEGHAVQDNYTAFLDQIEQPFLSAGSELDQLYVKADTNNLYLGVTGNLEQNGNAVLVFFDTRTGGQNVLTDIFGGGDDPNTPEQGDAFGVSGPPYALQNMENDQLDAGFLPDFVLHIDLFGGEGFVNWYELLNETGATVTDPNTGDEVRATRIYRGKIALSNGDNSLDGGAPGTPPLSIAFNNTNVVGVTGDSAANAATAVTGLEAAIPLSHLAIVALPASIRVQAIVVSSGGLVSNQSLPPLPAGTANLGDGTWFNGEEQPAGTLVNYAAHAGDQNATINLTNKVFGGTINGGAIPADFTAGDLIATQQNPTGFGDQVSVTGLRRGSEINQLFARDGLSPDSASERALEIGITGNLNTDGTNLVIFLDTIPNAGEQVLTGNPGRIDTNEGDKLPCAVDFAVLLNIFAGDVFVDIIDLSNNTSAFVGKDPDTNGDGILDNNGPVQHWRMRLDNSNLLGVNETAANDPQTANALTATKGVEMSIPLSAIGNPAAGSSIRLIALLTGANPGNREIANQILPAGLGGGKPSFGDGPTDLTNVGGQSYQCMTINIGPQCNNPRFDANGDNDVDQGDFGIFQRCMTGSNGGPVNSACECYDWNGVESDGDIDQEDYGIFQLCASGPTRAANPACDNPGD